MEKTRKTRKAQKAQKAQRGLEAYMDSIAIETFWAVVEHGSMTAAGRVFMESLREELKKLNLNLLSAKSDPSPLRIR